METSSTFRCEINAVNTSLSTCPVTADTHRMVFPEDFDSLLCSGPQILRCRGGAIRTQIDLFGPRFVGRNVSQSPLVHKSRNRSNELAVLPEVFRFYVAAFFTCFLLEFNILKRFLFV